jgi:hypothetical protein
MTMNSAILEEVYIHFALLNAARDLPKSQRNNAAGQKVDRGDHVIPAKKNGTEARRRANVERSNSPANGK